MVLEGEGGRGVNSRNRKKINVNCDKDVAKVRESVLLDRGA